MESAKKTFISMGALLIPLIIALSFLYAVPRTSLYKMYDDDYQNFILEFDVSEVAYLQYDRNYETSECYVTEDEDLVYGVYAGLTAVTVGKEVEVTATDADDIYTFVMEDGSAYTFTFNKGRANIDGTNYRTRNRSTLDNAAQDVVDAVDPVDSSE